MDLIWFYVLASVAVVSAVSFTGAATLAVAHRRMHGVVFFLVALAAGALFGDAIIHLLPESFERLNNTVATSLFILIGIVLFFILEKFLLWQHHHHIDEDESCQENVIQPLGKINLVSDGLHNFIDGALIGVSYLAGGPTVGFATTVAIVLHEIPQEIGDFALLLHAGFSTAKALWVNFLSALLAVAGAVIALAAGQAFEKFVVYLLPLAAGSFIYVAGSDLVPELHRTTNPKKSLIQLFAFLVGIVLMYLLVFLE